MVSENVCFSLKFSELFVKCVRFVVGIECIPLENIQILPMGNVRHFRRIRKHDVIFLKMCVFS